MSALMTTAAKEEWLRAVPLFSILSDAELAALAAAVGSLAVPRHGRVSQRLVTHVASTVRDSNDQLRVSNASAIARVAWNRAVGLRLARPAAMMR